MEIGVTASDEKTSSLLVIFEPSDPSDIKAKGIGKVVTSYPICAPIWEGNLNTNYTFILSLTVK